MTAATLIFMALVCLGAGLAVGVKNILHAIFGLAVALIGLAGLFLLLGSPFVAAMQVLIYVGGISVAMIFAVMLSTVTPAEAPESNRERLIAFAVAGAFFVSVGAILLPAFPIDLAATAPPVAVAQIGEALINRYNLIFEALSVVLLLAIVGAIVISDRSDDEEVLEP